MGCSGKPVLASTHSDDYSVSSKSFRKAIVTNPSKYSKLKLFLTATAKFHLLQIVNYRYFIDLEITSSNSILERIYQWETIAFVVAL